MKKPSKNQTDQIAPGDAALFRETVGVVKPLPKQNRITAHPAPRKPLLRSAVQSLAIPDTLSDFVPESTPDEYLSNGLSRVTLRKLRRGGWPVQDSLDLHGNNSDAARKLLQEFLHEAAQRKLRCVLVIHGKGLNSRVAKRYCASSRVTGSLNIRWYWATVMRRPKKAVAARCWFC